MYPTFALYPQLIPSVQLFDALHRGQAAVMQKKRLKFFWIIFVGIFVWEWFPVSDRIIYLLLHQTILTPRSRNILLRMVLFNLALVLA